MIHSLDPTHLELSYDRAKVTIWVRPIIKKCIKFSLFLEKLRLLKSYAQLILGWHICYKDFLFFFTRHIKRKFNVELYDIC